MAHIDRKRSLVLLLVAIPLACAHGTGATAGEDPSSPAAPVQLKFAWPDGFKSHVLIAHQSRRRGTEPTGILAHQRLTTEKKGDEVWVSTHDTVARGNDPDLETTVKINEALIQVVAPDGRFLRAEGIDQAMGVMKPSEGEDRENTRRALARSAATDWEQMVGAWVGKTLRPDDAIHKKLKTSVPLFAAAETTLDVDQVFEGRVPCADEETTRKCVALTYRARLAPEDRAATLERFKKLGGFKQGDPVPEDVHAEVETQLITEPDTLIPRRMTQQQRLRVRLAYPNGRVQEADERSEDVTIFADHPPTDAPAPDRRDQKPPAGKPSEKDKGQAL